MCSAADSSAGLRTDPPFIHACWRFIRRAHQVAAAFLLALAPALSEGQGADTTGAGETFGALKAACREDAGRLWGRPLCGGTALVDRTTRAVVASAPFPGGIAMAAASGDGAPSPTADSVWVGSLPPGIVVANHAFDWEGSRWAMVVLPLPSDPFGALALAAHESFHRLQDSLGLGGDDVAAAHLDEGDARLWLRLELRALAYALTTSGEASRDHARAALRFRAERHRRYPGAEAIENTLERREGMVEYTGHALASRHLTLGPLRTVRHMDEVERNPTLVRSFAYATGPALGLLLDRWAPRWREEVVRAEGPAPLLRAALGVPGRAAVADTADPSRLARPYGYVGLARAERTRDRARQEARARYLAALVDGPVITLRQEMLRRSFDPNNLVPLDSLGTVYPTGTLTAEWGRLELAPGGTGALVAHDFRQVHIAVSSVDALPAGGEGVIRGAGWTLTLADGWRVRADPARAGSHEVARVP